MIAKSHPIQGALVFKAKGGQKIYQFREWATSFTVACCSVGDQQLVSETGHLRKLHCKMEKRALSQLSPLITTDSYEFSDCLVFSRSGELMNFHIISKGLFVIYTLVGLLGS